MRVGLIVPNRGPVIGATSVAELLQLAQDADDGEWDSVWVGDSLLAKPRIDAIATLSAIAARTTRVELGVACMASTPLRDPLLLAYQWASLDVISGGRTVFVACQGGGPGSGEFAKELEAFGVQRESRSRRVEETIDIMRLAWSGRTFTYDGEYRRLSEVRVEPVPARQVPLWIAANPDRSRPKNVESAYRRVARLADGWQTTHTTPENVAYGIETIRDYAAEARRELPSDFEVCVCSNICVDDDRDAAWAEAKRFLDAHSKTDHPQELLERWVACGTADDCVSYLRRFRDAGATSILLRISSFSQVEQFKKISAEVLPALRAL